MFSIKKVGIIGLGLIGGSLAKALKKYCGIENIVALGRSIPPMKQALEDNTIQAYTTEIDHNFSDCDLIFICTPVDKIVPYIDKLIPIIKKDCILTDVGSTKNQIYKKLESYKNITFIGGHPMAGSEKIGYMASKDFLFENAFYVLTPYSHTDSHKIKLLEDLIVKIKAIPVIIPPDLHDYSVAAISHVPHVIASALVNTVKDCDDENKTMYTLAAGGFKDLTRIASASPEMWYSISLENKDEILKMLKNFKHEIIKYEEFLQNSDDKNLYTYFEKAKLYRDSFSYKFSGGYLKTYEILVEVLDKPGMIATIATLLSVNNINIKNIGIINNREFENGIMQILLEKQEDVEKSQNLLKEMNFTCV